MTVNKCTVSRCENHPCSNCGRATCPLHSLYLYIVHEIFSDVHTKYFCCGLCLASHMLGELSEKEKYYRTLDSSWIPVVNQLRTTVESVINPTE